MLSTGTNRHDELAKALLDGTKRHQSIQTDMAFPRLITRRSRVQREEPGKSVPRDVDQGRAEEDSAQFEIGEIEELPDEVD
jgi:hypothetical protein